MDSHLSSIQLKKFSPLEQARWALPGGEGKGEEGERGMVERERI